MKDLRFKFLDPRATLPKRATSGSSGFDVVALDDTVVSWGGVVVVPTGLSVEIPTGYELQVRSRSGLAARGMIVVNAPGTIDRDFVGEIKIILTVVVRDTWFFIRAGDRIAQLVPQRVPPVRCVKVKKLKTTIRGSRGLGSTGR